MRVIIFFLACLTTVFSNVAADKIIWEGDVSSSGNPTIPITLINHKKYQIKVSGYVNLAKWIQNKEELANDACYEFSKTDKKSKIEAFKNSNNISVCDNQYHPDHIYQSEPFIAKQNRIHFWIYDTNYDDNSGSLQVQVVELE